VKLFPGPRSVGRDKAPPEDYCHVFTRSDTTRSTPPQLTLFTPLHLTIHNPKAEPSPLPYKLPSLLPPSNLTCRHLPPYSGPGIKVAYAGLAVMPGGLIGWSIRAGQGVGAR
jgi:hypothetical protein